MGIKVQSMCIYNTFLNDIVNPFLRAKYMKNFNVKINKIKTTGNSYQRDFMSELKLKISLFYQIAGTL